MSNRKSIFTKDLNLTILIAVTVVILVLMALTLGNKMYSARNLSSMAFQISEFAVLSLGMGIVILLGGIDLSIVSNANLAGIMAAYVLSNEVLVASAGEGLTFALAIVVALVVATAGGGGKRLTDHEIFC